MITDFKIRTRGGQGALLSEANRWEWEFTNPAAPSTKHLNAGSSGGQVGHRPNGVSPRCQDEPEQWVEAGARLGYSSEVAGKTDPSPEGWVSDPGSWGRKDAAPSRLPAPHICPEGPSYRAGRGCRPVLKLSPVSPVPVRRELGSAQVSLGFTY